MPWFQYEVMNLGPVTIQVWGLFVALGMALSFFILAKRSRTRGIDAEKALNLAFWMVIAGFVGARLFHVFFYEPSYYFAQPLEIFKIWRGGFSSFGGFAGSFFIFWILTRSAVSKGKMPDVFSFAALYGWLVGRVGCFMIHDHLGAHSNCPMAIQTPDGPRLDMALVEILGLLPLALLFFLLRKKKMPDGFFTAVLFVYYGALRFILDFYRAYDIADADARWFGLTPAQYGSILLATGGIFLFSKIRKGGRVV